MNKRIYLFFTVLFLFVFLAGIFPQAAFAAKFGLSPVAGDLVVGGEHQIIIHLDTQGRSVNGVQAKLFFTPSLFEIVRVGFSSVFPSNFQTFDNAGGWLQIASGEDLPTAGFNGNSTWATLTFRAKSQGLSELRFSCPESAILELETTNDLLDCGSLDLGTYTIVSQTPPPTATPIPTSPPGQGGPVLTSTPTPTSVPACDETSPGTPSNLRAVSGSAAGQVKLTWTKTTDAAYYNLVFGSQSRSYQYGAPNIGNTDQYTVKGLVPGKLYYFAITGVRGCASSGFSQEASARAKAYISTVAPSLAPAFALTTSVIPTPSIPYLPIEEAYPDVEFPTPKGKLASIITPTPTAEPKNKQLFGSGRSIFIFALVVGLVGVLTIAVRRLTRRRLPPLPPENNLPPQPNV